MLEVEDLNEALDLSQAKPVLVFKQNTACSISAAAYEQFQSFLNDNNKDIGSFDGESQWDTSHMEITTESITEAINSLN